jgi:hypothetical protein
LKDKNSFNTPQNPPWEGICSSIFYTSAISCKRHKFLESGFEDAIAVLELPVHYRKRFKQPRLKTAK